MINNATNGSQRTQANNYSRSSTLQPSFSHRQSMPATRTGTSSSAVIQNLLQLIQNLLKQLTGRSQSGGQQQQAEDNHNSNSTQKRWQGNSSKREEHSGAMRQWGNQSGRQREERSEQESCRNKRSGKSQQHRPEKNRGTSGQNGSDPTITPPGGRVQLDLTDGQKQAIENLTGLQDIYVDDTDHSNTLSAGDNVTGGVTGASIRLGAADIGAIQGANDGSSPQLSLTNAQISAVEGYTGLRDIHVDDHDRSGTLSEGDVVVSSVPGAQKRELSAFDVSQINDFQPPYIGLTPAQKSAIEELTGLSNIRLDDNDLSDSLTAGDTAVSETTGERVDLSAEDIVAIAGGGAVDGGNTSAQNLSLDQSQIDAIRAHFDDTSPLAYDGLATEFTGTAIDKDDNGQLSVGDSVELRKYGGNGIPQTDYVEQHTLTASDIAAITSGSPTKPDTAAVSGGGVTVGGNNTLGGEPIPDDRIATIHGQQYSVGFLKTQVDDFTNSSYVPEITDQALKFSDWGTSSIGGSAAFERFIADTFPKGEPKP